ncbi:MAG: AraC family transcriptional regulator [Nevskia sp.]
MPAARTGTSALHTTTLTSWARAIRKALDAASVDSARLFAEAGLDFAALADPQARYPVEKTNRLWQLAVAATGDPAFGLTVARQSGPVMFHALGYSLVASTTLQEAFERLQRYCRVVSDGAEIAFHREGWQYRCEIIAAPNGVPPAFESIDAFACVILRMCRGLYRRDYAPLRLSFRRPRPDDVAPYERAFRTSAIAFGAAVNALWFDSAHFEQALESANPELARQNDEVALRYLARFGKSLVRERLRAVLIEQLPSGEPSQDRAAASLCLSARSLQRRLAEEGTSYKALLDEVRRELALSYLREGRNSISEITYLLGFSDTSSFTHAFRRWTGQPPSRWRAGES